MLYEVITESDVPLQGAEVTVHVVPGQPPANSGSFHAVWHEERPTREHRDYTVLETRGHGHYVGAVLVMSTTMASGILSGCTTTGSSRKTTLSLPPRITPTARPLVRNGRNNFV